MINLGKEEPIVIEVIPSSCYFTIAKQFLARVPLPTLLMANLHNLLIGPLCTTPEMRSAIVGAYENLRSIVDEMSSRTPSRTFELPEVNVKVQTAMFATPVNIVSQRLYSINHVNRQLVGIAGFNQVNWTKSIGVYNTAVKQLLLGDSLEINQELKLNNIEELKREVWFKGAYSYGSSEY